MSYFAYNVGGWVQKEGKMCLRNKSMAPYHASLCSMTTVVRTFQIYDEQTL